jgi:hypothetical protein
MNKADVRDCLIVHVLRAKNILVALLGGIFYSLSGSALKKEEVSDGS